MKNGAFDNVQGAYQVPYYTSNMNLWILYYVLTIKRRYRASAHVRHICRWCDQNQRDYDNNNNNNMELASKKKLWKENKIESENISGDDEKIMMKREKK